jgi:hypothetical protein
MTIIGAGGTAPNQSLGAEHSQPFHAYVMGIPGLKIATAASPEAAYGESQRGAGGERMRRRGSMMTYITSRLSTIMRVAGSATSAMRKPQSTKRVRNDEA